ncbi:hypothetical protein TNCV_4088561 [Trichonephila clavipes]|nr:hypothetical protein TNCV_4088561 [Trichonephila clavipes]
MKLIFRSMVTLIPITVASWRRQIYECTQRNHRNPPKSQFGVGSQVVPCLLEKDVHSTVTFMQDGATSHTANPVKEFLIQTFGTERVNGKRCKFPWPPWSPNLTPADFWQWDI